MGRPTDMENETSTESKTVSSVKTVLWLALGVAVYLMLQLWLLPKAGIST